MERLRVLIPDLTCPNCVPEIEQFMRQQEGVIWAIVNFAAGEATVIYDPTAFSAPRLVRAIDRLGYQIVPGDEPARRSRTRLIRHIPFAWMQQWARVLHLF